MKQPVKQELQESIGTLYIQFHNSYYYYIILKVEKIVLVNGIMRAEFSLLLLYKAAIKSQSKVVCFCFFLVI